MTKRMKVAAAWLLKEDWARWQEIDGELPAYERWLAKINQGMADAAKRGVEVEKVTVDPDVFVEWCRAEGKPIHRDSRAAYAAAQLMRRMTAH